MNLFYFLLFFATFVLAQDTSDAPSDQPDASDDGSAGVKTTTSKSSLLQPEFFVLTVATYFAGLFQL
ncbi:unnamed protein product [Rodentolepis nana]|uniref:Secreted protein n=1 Tax=Rodentolepis nana TaxID=102285 RepID=A0A0R3TDN1_RODNA|nr:unnamed protein product [Rodentolepis nana]VDO06163.1 unnamed protein product [Rodentolepis nana]